MTPRSFFSLFVLTVATAALLAGCGATTSPVSTSPADKAASLGMTPEQYKQTQQKAASMGMSMSEHMNMGK